MNESTSQTLRFAVILWADGSTMKEAQVTHRNWNEKKKEGLTSM